MEGWRIAIPAARREAKRRSTAVRLGPRSRLFELGLQAPGSPLPTQGASTKQFRFGSAQAYRFGRGGASSPKG